MSKSKIAQAKTTPDDFFRARELILVLPAPDLSAVLGTERGVVAGLVDKAVKNYMIDRLSLQGVSAVQSGVSPPKYPRGPDRYRGDIAMAELIETLLGVYVDVNGKPPAVTKGSAPDGEPTVRFIRSLLGAYVDLVSDDLAKMLPGLRARLQPSIEAVRKRVMRSVIYEELKPARASRTDG